MCAVIGYGGLRVLAGALSVGSLVAFYSFVTQLFDPLSGAANYTPGRRGRLPVSVKFKLPLP